MPARKRLKLDNLPLQLAPLGLSALLSLPADVWGLVCELVADNPSWLFAVWCFVCRTARDSVRPVSFSALRVRSNGPPIPPARWCEWAKITCLAIEGERTVPVLRLIRSSKTSVQDILLDTVTDQVLQEAANIHDLQGLGNIYQKSVYTAFDEGPALVPCQTWLSNCSEASDEALIRYLQVKRPHTLVLSLRRQGLSVSLCNLISTLTELRQLDLTHSRLPGESPLNWLAALKQLRHLNLAKCRGFTAPALAHLSGLDQLRYLKLNQTNLTDPALGHLSGLHNLRFLSLVDCAGLTTAGLMRLADLHQLRYLNLQHLQQVTDLRFVTDMTDLRELHLTNCDVRDDALVHLVNLRALRVLDLSGNDDIADTGLASVAQLAQLQELGLRRCYSITSIGLQHLSGLRHCLRKLDLCGCMIDEFKSLSELGELQDLSLGLPDSTGYELAYLPSRLQRLKFSGGPRLNDENFRHLSRLQGLRYLSVTGCRHLKSSAVQHLANLPDLREVLFSFCAELDDDVFRHFLVMQNLQKLDIAYAKISAEASAAFATERPGCACEFILTE